VAIDVARLFFPESWRTRLVFHSDDPSVACFTTNLKLKSGKYALVGSLTYTSGVLTAFLLPGGSIVYFLGFLASDVASFYIADSIVKQFGDIM
jgi:hypothetical protein